jgi:Rieske Fe-S protein
MASCAALATFVSACGDGESPTAPGGGSGSATPLGRVNAPFTQGVGVRVNVAGTALANVGGAVLAESIAGVFLISRTTDSAFTAIDANCTHEGCTVSGADGTVYVCPCHGSRYNRDGQVIQGPARASLRRYPSTFAEGIVTITV